MGGGNHWSPLWGVLISKLISGLIEWNKSQSECYNDRRVVQAEGKSHDRHQRPERSMPSIPKQRRLYVIRTLPGDVRWGWRRVGQVQCPREPGRRSSTKTRPDIGARWRNFFSGCCKNGVSEQETNFRDSTAWPVNPQLPAPWRQQS